MARTFVLILAFLCAVTVPAFSETYTIKFGDLPGGLEIQYEITTIIVGKITNTSPVPIGCRRLEIKRLGATFALSLDNSEVNLDSGASQSISRENPFYQNKLESWVGKECYTGLRHEFKNQSESNKFPWGTITGSLKTLSGSASEVIALSLENNSDQPIVIDWNESYFIDIDNATSRISFRGGTSRYVEIPYKLSPRATFQKELIPRKNIVSCTDYGAPCYLPLIPSMIAPELAGKIMKDSTGIKISLVLQLAVEGKKTTATLDFGLKSINAIPPKFASKLFNMP
jgi:hypothetical protein